MKKFSVLILVTFSLTLVIPLNVFAHSPGFTDGNLADNLIDPAAEDELVVSLLELGELNRILYSPYDSMRISFNIPPEWFFTVGSKFVLDYEVILGGTDLAGVPGNLANFVGVLSVVFNDQIIHEVYIDSSGEFTLEIDIPAEALISTRSNGRHDLALIFNSPISCEYDIRTSIVVKSSSYFALPIGTTPPALDLSNMPSPFYVRGNIRPGTTIFVVPNSPEPGELQAAYNVIGGFGSLTGADFYFETLAEDQLTEELVSSSNLIFVGKPESLTQLPNIQFPMPVENGKFANPPIDLTEEGVIQLAPSPWNPNKAVLLVSGITSESLNKAAQAISTGRIFVTGSSVLSFVADVQTEIDQYTVIENFTLKDLGYSTVSLGTGGFGFGTSGSSDVSYSFYLPKEQVSSQEGFIDLVYFTGRLVVGQSSITVSLNGEKIAAVVINEDTSGSLKRYKIDIPPGLLRFGENRLDFVVDLIPIYSCDTLGFPDYFIAIHENTQLNIPIAPGTPPEILPLDFRTYPGQFIESSDLGNIAFVLPGNDPLSWNVGSKVAFTLGRAGDPLISNMALAFSDDVSSEIRQGSDLIIVGRASISPFLVEISDQLPAPFNPDTDVANEKGLQVQYAVPPGVNLGYLELLTSPFNPENVVLVLSGNSDDGLVLAGNAITDTSLRRELMGLFAITNGSQIATSRVTTPFGLSTNQTSIAATLAPGGELIITTPFPTMPPDPIDPWSQPGWLVPVIIVSAAVLVLIIIWQIVVSGNSRRNAANFSGINTDTDGAP